MDRSSHTPAPTRLLVLSRNTLMRRILALIIVLMLMSAALPAFAREDAAGLNEAGKAAMTRGDVSTVARILQQLTDADDPIGMNNLGLLYYTAQGVRGGSATQSSCRRTLPPLRHHRSASATKAHRMNRGT